jgi:hypothetical protein
MHSKEKPDQKEINENLALMFLLTHSCVMLRTASLSYVRPKQQK